jgi:hypothetical protein
MTSFSPSTSLACGSLRAALAGALRASLGGER